MTRQAKGLTLVGLIILLVLVGIASFLFTWAIIEKKQETLIPAGVYVGELNVSGLNVEQALEFVKENTSVSTKDVKLFWPGGSYVLELAKLNPQVDYARLRSELISTLPKGNFLNRFQTRRRLLKEPKVINITLVTDEGEFNKLVQTLDRQVAFQAEDAHFQIDVLDNVKIVKENNGRKVDYEKLFSELPIKLAQGETEYLLPIKIVEPQTKAEYLYSLGIKELVAKFYTKFDATNVNRVSNLQLAAKALDGTILNPGEEFSFNAWVGPRLKELGYKDAPTLVGGEITEDVGGGVCQLSSTLYNLALLADMQIIERMPHSTPVSYIAPGLDAAVSFDYLDLSFRNTHSSSVLITAQVIGDRIWCKMFGTRLPYNIKIVTEKVEEIPFEIKQGSKFRQGKNGLRVNTYIIKAENKTLVSKDYYKPLDQLVP